MFELKFLKLLPELKPLPELAPKPFRCSVLYGDEYDLREPKAGKQQESTKIYGAVIEV